MGTRGLAGFIHKGVRKGCYNNNDSYPSGLGDAIIGFILSLSEKQWDEMARKVAQLEWIDENEVDEIDTDQYNLLGQVWHGQKQLVGQTDFLEDGLYCEYAYFVDFEKKVLEVEGVLENTLIIAFKDLKEGVIDKMKALSEGEEKGEEQKDGEMNWKSAKMAKAFDDSMKAMGYSCSSGGAASQGGK